MDKLNFGLFLLLAITTTLSIALLGFVVRWTRHEPVLFNTCEDDGGTAKAYLLGMVVGILVLARLSKQSLRIRLLQRRLLGLGLHVACFMGASSHLTLSVLFFCVAYTPQVPVVPPPRAVDGYP